MGKNVNEFYLVVGRQPWNRRIFSEEQSSLKGEWLYIDSDEDLVLYSKESRKPRFAFFLHWSEKVAPDILENWECVCFHMTDVPYGRGGSPLQNLIARGHRKTKLTALRMTGKFDAGPVYLKKELSIEGGTAEEIYIRATRLSFDMIREIIDKEPIPVEQAGEIVNFRRRKPSESKLPESLSSIEDLHNFIRMLDAQGYPKAHFDIGRIRIEFSGSSLYHDKVEAKVSARLIVRQ